MKKMHTYFCLLLLLVGFVRIEGAEMESTINSPITKNLSEMSTDELKETLKKVISQNNDDMVSKILAQPQAKNFDEYALTKALEIAANMNYVNIARILIQAGAHIKERYCYALENAAEKGHSDMVKVLLPVQGCDKRDYSKCYYMDINYFNAKRDDALIRAAKNGHVDVMKELINAGANVNFQNNFGQTALVEAAKNDHIGAVKELLKARVNVNAFNQNGQTALIIAMRKRNVELIRELLMAPGINVASEVSTIQRNYIDYLNSSDGMKRLNEECNPYHKIDLQIYELFKPFMKL